MMLVALTAPSVMVLRVLEDGFGCDEAAPASIAQIHARDGLICARKVLTGSIILKAIAIDGSGEIRGAFIASRAQCCRWRACGCFPSGRGDWPLRKVCSAMAPCSRSSTSSATPTPSVTADW